MEGYTYHDISNFIDEVCMEQYCDEIKGQCHYMMRFLEKRRGLLTMSIHNSFQSDLQDIIPQLVKSKNPDTVGVFKDICVEYCKSQELIKELYAIKDKLNELRNERFASQIETIKNKIRDRMESNTGITREMLLFQVWKDMCPIATRLVDMVQEEEKLNLLYIESVEKTEKFV
jgi:hypothetical protein